VVLAVRDRVLQLNVIPKVPALWQSLRPAVQTDLGFGEVLSLARLGVEIDPEHIRTLIIDDQVTSNWTTPEGHQVLLPEGEKIQEALQELFSGSEGDWVAGRPPVCPKIEGPETPEVEETPEAGDTPEAEETVTPEEDGPVGMSGALVGRWAGEYEYHEFTYLGDGSEVMVRMVFEPDDPVTKDGVGFVVFSPEGEVGRGDETGRPGEREMTFSSHVSGTYTIQVYNYIEGITVHYGIERK
jgi:hypothetical protein